MGDFKKGVFSWWKACTSGSSKLVLYLVVPLVVVSGFVGLLGTTSSNMGFDFRYYARIWSISGGGRSSVFSSSSTATEGPVAPPEERLDLRPRVVGGSRRDEALSADNILNRSSAPPLAVEAIETPPHVNKEESLNITANGTRIIPSLNQSHDFPIDVRIRKEYTSLDRLEAGLGRARAAIRDAKNGHRLNDSDYIPTGPMYWNPSIFHRLIGENIATQCNYEIGAILMVG
ncbi:hypothetical protein RJ639_006109 [Escallonia herrerae]|uniref:Uncharacterized protein n=1 Tax=Escallonia herrerae TaxID=1293975 RepID=A0AA89AUM5_9ASTE|nr:hypothetical protein RJ639_015732 [Escallonia herrerae]KAK3017504.1 hypothetical protein RJ639_006109 [Escallonia herrerae]